MNIYLIEGPLMDRIDERPKEHYGSFPVSRNDMLKRLDSLARKYGASFFSFQSNIEGEIVSYIAETDADAFIVNVAAYTHTSIAIRDALEMKAVPVVECHLSRVFAREFFRQKSLISAVSTGVISGFGLLGYELALRALLIHRDEGK